MPVLITLSATSTYNEVQKSKDENFTFSNFDNLGMGNIEVRPQLKQLASPEIAEDFRHSSPVVGRTRMFSAMSVIDFEINRVFMALILHWDLCVAATA